jgi:UDP-N-acetylglucosamine--N-acetylmuramyl-(pentapeptide) pyrophosphoryl-undecaprenol N-acetylglucosamine transferase
MAGGGTGGHVIPAIAVARELAARGHRCVFVGTRAGMEARLVPAAGFAIEWIEVSGLQRVGAVRTMRALWRLPRSTWRVMRLMGRERVAGVFSMGGYVAGPALLAARLKGAPVVAMEPNALPGLVTRRTAAWAAKTLVSFEETLSALPPGKAEVAGLPVRSEFFTVPPQPTGSPFTVLVTGGSQGSRALNRAMREAWPLFRDSLQASGRSIRFLHQAGRKEAETMRKAFAGAGLEGQVLDFIEDMPAAFAEAALVVCRSGAGSVAELRAAGRPSILVPFPHAADDHQTKNAEAMVRDGAAVLIPESELTGERLVRDITNLQNDPDRLRAMGEAARSGARPGAAGRAADLLEEFVRSD